MSPHWLSLSVVVRHPLSVLSSFTQFHPLSLSSHRCVATLPDIVPSVCAHHLPRRRWWHTGRSSSGSSLNNTVTSTVALYPGLRLNRPSSGDKDEWTIKAAELLLLVLDAPITNSNSCCCAVSAEWREIYLQSLRTGVCAHSIFCEWVDGTNTNYR